VSAFLRPLFSCCIVARSLCTLLATVWSVEGYLSEAGQPVSRLHPGRGSPCPKNCQLRTAYGGRQAVSWGKGREQAKASDLPGKPAGSEKSVSSNRVSSPRYEAKASGIWMTPSSREYFGHSSARPGTMRNRSQPGQVARAGFGRGRIAVTQRVSGCYCASARANDSGGFRASGISQMKDAERRDKVSVGSGKDTRSRQDP
jgi:hypothetical protein